MSPVRSSALLALGAAVLACTPAPARSDAGPGYQTPPPVVRDILTAPRVPRTAPSVSPDGARMLLPELPALIPIAVLAEPVDKLAGLEVLASMHCSRGQLKTALSGFSIAPIAGGHAVRARLPEGARVGRAAWSNHGDRVACALYSEGGAQVWVVDAATGAAHALAGVRLNTVLDPEFDWTMDDRAILCAAVSSNATAAPAASRIPGGPELRVGAGKATPQRTARDVLRTAEDQQRFALACTAQLTRVPVDGGAALPVGEPAMFVRWALSRDERHLAVEKLDAIPPGFPVFLFPRSVEIRTGAGAHVADVGSSPLNDRSAISSVAPLGPRSWSWSPDGNALWFASWQDTPGADAMRAIKDPTLPPPGTDRLMRLEAPFTGTPTAVATSDFPLDGFSWTSDGAHLVLRESYAPRRRARLVAMNASGSEAQPTTLVERSTEGVYDDPGEPLTRAVPHGSVLWTNPGGHALYFSGAGFRADGQRPFLDRVDLATGRKTRVFESAPDVLEPVQTLLSEDGTRFITSRQSNRMPPNWYLHAGKNRERALSTYSDPAPALTASQRFQFTFVRSDSVRLNAEVVLPADWKKGTRLPTILWVYPNDYRSAAAASENRRSPNRFPSQSALNPEVLVTQGYAVVYPDIAVVGTNDRYVEEIRKSAQAVIDEAVRQGFCDRTRVGVGGHSYGAFSTANLLAHTDLFRAGIASDGAYNRTLTPFTFQAEERTFWEAPDTYLTMSPFVHADHIHSPLLLLHNLDDTNVGTNPIQSERMYEALNGMGKTVSLVEYPYEDHGPAARETVLDYWTRVLDWYDRYVKNAGAAGAQVAPTP
jgi:dipeptidyl aminopeptidase/acylaminoacyl peptidase